MRLTALCALTTVFAAGCGHLESHVQTDDAALGRVVVYRNGIAYYERRAQRPADGALTLQVPNDKIDDFLKSLTITEADTGRAVPVSYPTQGASKGSTVEMTVQLPADTKGDLQISYITDSPAWKPTYRVVVGDDGKARVQGWAIVDNTSGEDWSRVKVGVGSSSALSFRYDLRSVVKVDRELLGGGKVFVQAPPAGGSTTPAGGKKILLALGDEDLQASRVADGIATDSAQEVVTLAESEPARVTSGGAGVGRPARGAMTRAKSMPRRAKRPVAPKKPDPMIHMANRLRALQGAIVIDGYATPGEARPGPTSLRRANTARNRLIELGIAPARIRVEAKGVVPGRARGGVELRHEAPKASQSGAPIADGAPVGESHFESKQPMTIAKGTSAMVSVLNEKTPGEVVYLYAPDDARGDKRFAFRAARFTNPTDYTLEAGPVTVYGKGRFIGEGMAGSTPPKATAVIPFALDRQVLVERTTERDERISEVVDAHRGVFTAKIKHIQRTIYEATNRRSTPTTLYLRHPLARGWTLEKHPESHERQGELQLFAVRLEAGESRRVVVEASTPMTRVVDLRSRRGVMLMRTYLSSAKNDTFVNAARELLTLSDALKTQDMRTTHLRQRQAEFQTRATELTHQIVDLRRSKAGRKLLKELESKLSRIEQARQAATLKIAEAQERSMLTRIRLQEALSELNYGISPLVDVASAG